MIKDLKLSDAMIKMITEAQYHEVLVNGEIVHRGYMVAGRVGTVVALMDRGLCTARTVEYHGVHWLTGLGLRTWAWITGNDLPASEDHPASEPDMITDAGAVVSDPDSAQIWADRGISPRSLSLAIEGVKPLIPAGVWASEVLGSVSAGVALAESILCGHIASVDGMDMWMLDETVDTVDAVNSGLANGQIERAWDEAYAMAGEIAAHEESEAQWADVESASDYDRRNADLERADIESEYRAEAEAEASEASWVPVEVINADDLMYRTRKGIWLSAGYFRTMRLVRADRLRVFLAFKAAQKIIQERYSGGRVTFLDEMLADEKVSFTAVDKARRTILAVCNPTLGSKVKPSSKKRNKR